MSRITKRANKKAVTFYGWNTSYQRVYEEGYAEGAKDEQEDERERFRIWYESNAHKFVRYRQDIDAIEIEFASMWAEYKKENDKTQ